MHRDAAPVVDIKTHLARVHAGTDLDPEVTDRCDDRLSASDRTSWTIEGREDRVACGIDVAAPVTFGIHAEYVRRDSRGPNANLRRVGRSGGEASNDHVMPHLEREGAT